MRSENDTRQPRSIVVTKSMYQVVSIGDIIGRVQVSINIWQILWLLYWQNNNVTVMSRSCYADG